jgi:predicted amidohydrolase
MSNWADPAALFIELYDQLPEEVFLGSDPIQWKGDREVRRDAQRVCDHIQKWGEADPKQVERIIYEGGHRGRFAVLTGIDMALEIINPWTPSFEYGNLAKLARRYAQYSRLDEPSDDGALLPRCAYPGRPAGPGKKALYFGLHRVTPESWARIRHERLPAKRGPSLTAGEKIKVGCAPLLETFADVKIEILRQGHYNEFDLTAVNTESLRNRISSVIRKLDDSEAVIGIIPEGALTDELLKYWQQQVVSTTAYSREHGGKLRWLLVGTGPLGADDPPPNRAVLIDRRSGKEILSQDKLSAFVLSVEQAIWWNLPGEPISRPAYEHITRGSAVTVLETSLGRLAIVICEDLSQTTDWKRELVECGVSHLFAPIFSDPIREYRWVRRDVENLLSDTGAWLIVANSLVVQSTMDPMAHDTPDDWYTCLVVGPRDPERNSHNNYEWQFGSAETGDDLALASSKLPEIRVAMLHELWFRDPPEPNGT